MVKNPSFAVIFVSAFLVVYCILAQLPATEQYAEGMFFASPFLVVWMVYAVVRYGTYNGRSLDGDEFGYGDRFNSDLGLL